MRPDEPKAATEHVHFHQCDGCGRWFVSTNEHARRFCDANCRNRFNVRAWRTRRKAASS